MSGRCREASGQWAWLVRSSEAQHSWGFLVEGTATPHGALCRLTPAAAPSEVGGCPGSRP